MTAACEDADIQFTIDPPICVIAQTQNLYGSTS
jgi:hypothetical protein